MNASVSPVTTVLIQLRQLAQKLVPVMIALGLGLYARIAVLTAIGLTLLFRALSSI